jgi:hypothetical protein
MHEVNDVTQTEVHTAAPLVPEPSASEVELAIEKVKSHRSPGIDQITVDLIRAGGGTNCYEIHNLIISIWNMEELPEERKESVIVPIYKKRDKSDCIIVGANHFCQLGKNFIEHPADIDNAIMRQNYTVQHTKMYP